MNGGLGQFARILTKTVNDGLDDQRYYVCYRNADGEWYYQRSEEHVFGDDYVLNRKYASRLELHQAEREVRRLRRQKSYRRGEFGIYEPQVRKWEN